MKSDRDEARERDRTKETSAPPGIGRERLAELPIDGGAALEIAIGIIDGCQQHLRRQDQRIREVEARLARYDRAFERMFADEAEKRLNLKGNDRERGEMALEVPQLERLRMDLERRLGQERARNFAAS